MICPNHLCSLKKTVAWPDAAVYGPLSAAGEQQQQQRKETSADGVR